jgi:gliding motility-associated-like protein
VHAAFTANPTSGIEPLPVDFTNLSTGATSYIWIFGDGNGSTATNPSNTFVTAGVYTTTLVAIAGSCIDSATVTIVVEPALFIEVPNVFTPNGDRANDVFYIHARGVKELSLVIFNRWGKKVHEASGANASWDGSGANDGTYFYIMHAEGNDGNTVDKQGTINLFR